MFCWECKPAFISSAIASSDEYSQSKVLLYTIIFFLSRKIRSNFLNSISIDFYIHIFFVWFIIGYKKVVNIFNMNIDYGLKPSLKRILGWCYEDFSYQRVSGHYPSVFFIKKVPFPK